MWVEVFVIMGLGVGGDFVIIGVGCGWRFCNYLDGGVVEIWKLWGWGVSGDIL